jgi:hypothetical protein
VISLHPCQGDATCVVGPEAAPRDYTAIIGADALAGDAVRLRLGFDQVLILADVAGGEVERTEACDAVFPSPYRGGGTLVIGGTELGFAGRRVTMQTCLGANPDPAIPQASRGADALMLISTGIGTSLLGESAYARYRLVRETALPLDELTLETVNLPSGPITGRRTTVASHRSSPARAARHARRAVTCSRTTCCSRATAGSTTIARARTARSSARSPPWSSSRRPPGSRCS